MLKSAEKECALDLLLECQWIFLFWVSFYSSTFLLICKLWEILPTSISDNVYTSLTFNGNDIALFVVGPEWMHTESGSSKSVGTFNHTDNNYTRGCISLCVILILKKCNKKWHMICSRWICSFWNLDFFFCSTAIKQSVLCCSKTIIVTCR